MTDQGQSLSWDDLMATETDDDALALIDAEIARLAAPLDERAGGDDRAAGMNPKDSQ